MAEVHIVDIDGEQWDMKDQPLTTRVTNLEGQVQENTRVIQDINKDVKAPFKAIRGVTKVTLYPFEACIISGVIQLVGAFMAILVNLHETSFVIHDLYGQASGNITVTPLGDYEVELSLNGVINVFGVLQGAS